MPHELKRVSIVFYLVVETGDKAPSEEEQLRRCLRLDSRAVATFANIKPADAIQICEDGLDDIDAFGDDESGEPIGRTRDWLKKLHNEHICAGCHTPIDPDMCGCGSGKDGGHESHVFVPMGCNCMRAKPEKPQVPPIGTPVRLLKERHINMGGVPITLKTGAEGKIVRVSDVDGVWAEFKVTGRQTWCEPVGPNDVAIIADESKQGS